jgi:hypothetical protein
VATLMCTQPTSELPGWAHALRSVLATLDWWVRTSRPAPPGLRFQTNADGSVKRDTNGNVLGGVRSHWVDVPISSYVATSGGAEGCAFFGHEVPFPAARLQELYRNRADYDERLTDFVFELAASRYVRNEDASAERDAASAASLRLPRVAERTEGLSGHWTLRGSIAGVRFASTCRLRQVEATLRGTCTMEGYEAALVEGSVQDRAVRWIYPFRSGLTMRFSGVAGSTSAMKGVVTASAEGEWSAVRQ